MNVWIGKILKRFLISSRRIIVSWFVISFPHFIHFCTKKAPSVNITEGTKIYEFRVTTLIHYRLTPIASASTGKSMFTDTLALSRALPSQPKGFSSRCAAPRPSSILSASSPSQLPEILCKIFQNVLFFSLPFVVWTCTPLYRP